MFEPSIAAIPEDLRGKLHPAELYHEILEHRWFLSEAAGRDIGLDAAIKLYVENVLRFAPNEAGVIDSERAAPLTSWSEGWRDRAASSGSDAQTSRVDTLDE